jgi:hypothetical protein
MDCAGGMAKLSSSSGIWTGYKVSNSNIPDHTVISLQADTSGVIWASHINVNVSSFNGSTWTVYDVERPIDKFTVDGQGNLWGCGEGLFKFDQNGEWNAVSLPEAADTTYALGVAVDTVGGNFWLSTYSGLWLNTLNTAPAFEVETIVADEDFETFNVQVAPALVPESEQWQTVSYTLINPDDQKITATINPLTGEITLTSVPNAFGTASLKIIANDGQALNNTYEVLMTITINPVEDVVTAIEDRAEDNVNFFPNPFSTTLSWSTGSLSVSSGTVVITDMMGREVKRSVVAADNADINVSDLPSGVYLAKLVWDHSYSKLHKVVKAGR